MRRSQSAATKRSLIINPINFPNAFRLVGANQIAIFQLHVVLGAGPRFFVPPISRKQKRSGLIYDLSAQFGALEMSPNLRFAGSSFERNHALFVAGQIEGAGRPSHFSEVAVLRTRSGSIFSFECSRRTWRILNRNIRSLRSRWAPSRSGRRRSNLDYLKRPCVIRSSFMKRSRD